MRPPLAMHGVRAAALLAFHVSYWGLLQFSVFAFLGPGISEGPFGITTVILIMLAATLLPMLRWAISDHAGKHRTYLWTRWGLTLGAWFLGVPIVFSLVEYAGPYNVLALLLGLLGSLVLLAVAAAVGLPPFLMAAGTIRARPGFVHAAAATALLLFPLTTVRLFLAGSQDRGTFLLAWSILAGFLLAWDWGDVGAKIGRSLSGLVPGMSRDTIWLGLVIHVATSIAALGASLLAVDLAYDALVERTILGGPTSYGHLFFWLGILLAGILSLGFLARAQATRPAPSTA